MSTVSKLKQFFEEGAFKNKPVTTCSYPPINDEIPEKKVSNDLPNISDQSSEKETPTKELDNKNNLETIKFSNYEDEDQHNGTVVQNEIQNEESQELPKIKKEDENKPQPSTNKLSAEEIIEIANVKTKKNCELEETKLIENITFLRKSTKVTNQEEPVEMRNNHHSLLEGKWHTRSTQVLADKEVETVKNSQEIRSLIESLKYSESKYLDDLKGVVSVYLFTIKRHSSELIKARSNLLSQRVEFLLDCQKKFAFDLLSVYSIDDLTACFAKHTHLMYLYEEFLVDELGHITTVLAEVGTNFQKEVNLKDMLTSRLSDYNISLKEIATLSDNMDLEGPIKRVVQVASVSSKSSGELIKLNNKFDQLKLNKKVPSWVFTDCNMDDNFGNYLLNNTFIVSSEQDKNGQFSVHLYSKVMLFAKENENSYYYQKHISMEEIGQIRIEPPTKKKHSFSFSHFTKCGVIRYKFKKTSKEIAQLWVKTIEELLKEQQDILVNKRQVAQLNP